jgi:hypothetical protein
MKLEGRAKDSLNVKETFTAGYLASIYQFCTIFLLRRLHEEIDIENNRAPIVSAVK